VEQRTGRRYFGSVQLTHGSSVTHIGHCSDHVRGIAALRLLLERFEAAALVTYVGGGRAELVQALQSVAADLGVAGLVDLQRGQQAPEGVVALMQQAHIMVNPIVVGKPEQLLYYIRAGGDSSIITCTVGETFGFVHVEAAAQRLPVIAFDTRANAESIQPLSAHRGNNSSCPHVTNALLPYREGEVLSDLALAILRAYIQHEAGRRCEEKREASQEGAQDIEEKNPRAADICGAELPALRHWNTQQHSRALVEALQLL
jgi:glycosyltransferase involved in cell wall biosynthesis